MGRTILLVDDNAEMLAGLQLALELEGYDVLAAADGLQALALLSTSAPDLCLFDLKMPHMDGLTLLQRGRSCVML